jgi:S1-C subfamily serine protease
MKTVLRWLFGVALATSLIVFGMVLGARLDRPARAEQEAVGPVAAPVSTAASDSGTVLPAASTTGGSESFPSGLLENERNTIDVFRRVSNSVVYITNRQLRRDLFSMNVFEIPAGTGSGFIWDKQGHVVTNFHVVQNGNSFTVTLANGTTYPAALIGSEPTKDLAVLLVDVSPDSLSPVTLGDSGDLMVGQKVLALGNPFGLDQTLTTGVISAVGREIRSVAGTLIEGMIQTDASINPGNSGGTLIDSSERLIGVNTAIVSPSGTSAGVGFAVPVNTVKQIVPQLIRYGKVKHAGLAISVISDALARRWGVKGVIVRQVADGSDAAKAGLHSIQVNGWGQVVAFDVITALDGEEIDDFDDLFAALDKHKPGDEVTLTVRRGDKTLELPLTLEEVS